MKKYDEIKRHLNQRYGLHIEKISLAKGGYLSDNYIAEGRDGKYFVKTYRSKYDLQDIKNIHKVKQYFCQNNIPVIMPLKTQAGETFSELRGKYYAIFPFVSAKTLTPAKAPMKAVRSMAGMQANIHLLSRHQLPKIHETTVSVWHKTRALSKGRKIVNILAGIKNPDKFDKTAMKLVPWKMTEIKRSRVTPSSIGLKNDHLVHGDYHGLNLFFDDNDEVSHVYDLEKTVLAPRSYELVRAMDYICLDDFDFRKAGEYLRAYREVYPISDSEFRKGFLFYATKGVFTFWIEEAHYLENNSRTDVFYENDNTHTKYYHEHFEEMVNQIIKLSKEK